MEKINFNRGWEFTFENSLDEFNLYGIKKTGQAHGAPSRFYDHSNWQRIDLPHDWAMALKKDLKAEHGRGARNYSSFNLSMTDERSEGEEIYNIGWYRKNFVYDESWADKRVFVEFEGIFRDSAVWVNGVYMDNHFSGYTGFILEITEQLVPGEDNSIAVRVNSDQPEGWWYEGSGIYRNVNLLVSEPVYFKPWETIVRADIDGNADVSAIIVNDTADEVTVEPKWEIIDACGNVCAAVLSSAVLAPYSETAVNAKMKVDSP